MGEKGDVVERKGWEEVGILSPLNHLNLDILDCSTLCQADVCTKAAVSMVICAELRVTRLPKEG